MKRFHVHVGVNDVDASIRFYSKVFGAAPTVARPDYAKWMLEDPRLNFAISARGGRTGVNHLGLQVDTDAELQDLRAQLADADAAMVAEAGANCCYARSDKYWVTDPQGVAWETYHTLGAIPFFGDDTGPFAQAAPPASAPASGGCAPAGDAAGAAGAAGAASVETATVSARIPVASKGCCT